MCASFQFVKIYIREREGVSKNPTSKLSGCGCGMWDGSCRISLLFISPHFGVLWVALWDLTGAKIIFFLLLLLLS